MSLVSLCWHEAKDYEGRRARRHRTAPRHAVAQTLKYTAAAATEARAWQEKAYSDSYFARQRKNALAICLGVRGFTRLMINKALALSTTQQFICPLRVG